MPKYRITLLREICHDTTLVIEAETSTDAMKIAQVRGYEVVFDKKYPTEYRVLACVKIIEGEQ